MKIILDCNIWISFLLGKQHSLLKKVLTDMRFDVYVCRELMQEIVADYIVSGDKDLTDLECHQQTKIIKLADFKKMLSL